MPVTITRDEHSATDLRREAARSRNADAARRMLALALVLEGKSRSEAARSCGMDRQTLRDWVHRFNAHGPDGLINIKPPGRPPSAAAASLSGTQLCRKHLAIPSPDLSLKPRIRELHGHS